MKPTEIISGDLYTILKRVSEEKQVDNPSILDLFFSSNLNHSSWPYLGLCQDQDNNKYTWHIACEEIFLSNILNESSRDGFLTAEVSMIRKKQLKIMDLYLRNGNHYVFN
jgi:hypothetical protein